MGSLVSQSVFELSLIFGLNLQVSTPLSIEFPESLPVSLRRGEIMQAIDRHQVVIICGETGSGKTTQLPKMALALGRGAPRQRAVQVTQQLDPKRNPNTHQHANRVGHFLIGHTQPRRIAATSVAKRIADELKTALGDLVGYKVRFQDKLTPTTRVKLMTDGILLAESQNDPLLRAYDTIIIDEAHERSLNIDFLLGHLKQILPQRPDLKVIVTSATIDANRFAEHFSSKDGPAPVLLVSGRMFPVEMRYRPFEEERDYGWLEALADAVDELWVAKPKLSHPTPALSHVDLQAPAQTESELVEIPSPSPISSEESPQPEPSVASQAMPAMGDILVFLPGEREIRDAMGHLTAHLATRALTRRCEVVPLFARLTQAEQERVFQTGGAPRIVLATNVAETSLTVPGIRYVIDIGTARVKRYSYRSKVEQLLVEPISDRKRHV